MRWKPLRNSFLLEIGVRLRKSRKLLETFSRICSWSLGDTVVLAGEFPFAGRIEKIFFLFSNDHLDGPGKESKSGKTE